MKKYNDERYQKYLHIIYEWTRTIESCYTVRIYDIRKEQYRDNSYYVFGIGCSNFLEPDDYDLKKDWCIGDTPMKNKEQKEVRDIVKMMCKDDRISLDDFERLNKDLKEAGAIKVYLHPATYDYKGHEMRDNDMQLIVIQDEDETKENI